MRRQFRNLGAEQPMVVNISVKFGGCPSNGLGVMPDTILLAGRHADRQTDRQTTKLKTIYFFLKWFGEDLDVN